MEWWQILAIVFGSFIVLIATGMPLFVCFLTITIIGAVLIWGGTSGSCVLPYSIFHTLGMFGFLPISLFILMGELMFHTGMATQVMDALDMWLGRLHGRLSLLAVGTGTVMAALSGSMMASIGMLGRMLVPEMEKRGYKKQMTLGPVMASGGLAIMIPPSTTAIVLGMIARISIGRLLVAIISPGLLMAALYAAYIIIRCWLQPSIAPKYIGPAVPLLHKLKTAVWQILPLGLIIFSVTGVIFLGIATPSEAAAIGAVSCVIIAAMYRRLSWHILQEAISGTIRLAVMILMIIATALAYSEMLAFSGATKGLVEFATVLPVAPMFIFAGLQLVGLLLGMFMPEGPIIMMFIPIAMPVILALGINPLWFCVIFMVNLEIGMLTPPFGVSLFIMKGVAPSGTTVGDCIRSGAPFIGLNALAMALMIIFPPLVLWLPSVMR